MSKEELTDEERRALEEGKGKAQAWIIGQGYVKSRFIPEVIQKIQREKELERLEREAAEKEEEE